MTEIEIEIEQELNSLEDALYMWRNIMHEHGWIGVADGSRLQAANAHEYSVISLRAELRARAVACQPTIEVR